MLPVAVFRFSPTEGPAHFAAWLDARALPWTVVALDRGDPVPDDPTAFAGIGMMGGPMSVNDALPWIAPLNRLVRAAVEKRVPVIGHCLGGQLLAQSLGARVTRTAVPEIGWIDVTSTDDARARDWLGERTGFTPFQWHYDVFDLPAGAVRLLTNRYNPNQAYVVDERHIGFQCHVEMTQDLVETWCRTGAAELPDASHGPLQSRDDILRDAPSRLAALNAVADSIYDRWARALGSAS
jgi:GMP synthase-like glutamine amidotransferase